MSPFSLQLRSTHPTSRLCALWAEAVHLSNRLARRGRPELLDRSLRREQRRWLKYLIARGETP